MNKQKIYGFCDLKHNASEKFKISDHPIIALDETGECVSTWISSNHSFGKTDILRGIRSVKGDNWQETYDFEWVEDPDTHTVLQKILNT